MGRARGNIKTAAVRGFDSILGARRGDLGAQAARDATERETREHARTNFFQAVEGGATFASVLGDGERAWVATELFAAYHRGEHRPSAPAYGTFIIRLQRGAAEHGHAGLIAAVDYGDPAGYEGLTEPAIAALAAYLRSRDRRRRKRRWPDAIAVVCRLLVDQRDPAIYERRISLYEAVTPLIADASQSLEGGPMLCDAAANVLAEAPVGALTSPLRSWVPVFAERVRRGFCSKTERQSLVSAVVAASSDPDSFLLMAPLTTALRDTTDVSL